MPYIEIVDGELIVYHNYRHIYADLRKQSVKTLNILGRGVCDGETLAYKFTKSEFGVNYHTFINLWVHDVHECLTAYVDDRSTNDCLSDIGIRILLTNKEYESDDEDEDR